MISTAHSLQQIPPGDIRDRWKEWEEVFLKVPQTWEDTIALPALYESLVNGKNQLWTLKDEERTLLLLLTCVVQVEKGLLLQVLWATGQDARSAVTSIAALELWAAQQGCVELEILGRVGWERLLKTQGYVRKQVVLGKTLPPFSLN